MLSCFINERIQKVTLEFLLYVSWNASLTVKVIISLNNLQQPEQIHAICH